MESKPHFFLGLPADADALMVCRMSFLIAANNFRVGTRFSSSLPSLFHERCPVNLIDIQTMFPSDEKCRELLVRLRWPEGPRCPRCKADAVELETEKQLFYCKDCDYQFSVTAGTIFNDSHLPLISGSPLPCLLCEAKKGMSACQIQRTLGIGGYKTAWYLCHRIRAAMREADKPMLDGTVEMDDTYVGGVNKGKGRVARVDNKEVVTRHPQAQWRSAIVPCQRCEVWNARKVHPREYQRRCGRDYDRRFLRQSPSP